MTYYRRIGKLLLLMSLLASGLTSQAVCAAGITWGAPATISADTDVFAVGNPLAATYWRSSGTSTVNGVLFTSTTANSGTIATYFNLSGTGLFANLSDPFNSGSNPFNSLSSSYKALLVSGNYGNNNTVTTITLQSLVANHQYAVQFWVNDPRATIIRSESITSSGGNTQTLQFNSSGVGSAGSPGQYSLGGFSASGTTQAFTITPVTGTTPAQTQAIQLRDVTGVWSGATDGNWDNSTANFTGSQDFTTVSGLVSSVYFADTDGFKNAVTNNTVSVQAGGVTIGAVNFQNSAVNYTFQNASGTTGITGASSINKTGTGTVNLNSANTFTGNTTISAGSLVLKNSNALQNSTLTTSGVVFDSSVGTNAFTLGGLSGSGNLALQNNASTAITLSVGNNNTNTSYGGTLSGTGGALTKIGNGKLTLTNSNTYTGATNITAGTLEVGTGGTLGNTSVIVGNGSFSLNGGTVTSNAGFRVGNLNGDIATATISSGTMTFTSADWMLGSNNSNTNTVNWTQTNGTVTVNTNNAAYVGTQSGAGSSTLMTVSGGTFRTGAAGLTGEIWLGLRSNAEIKVSGTGTVSTGRLRMALNSGVTGTVTLDGGTFAMQDAYRVNGNGTFNLNFNGGTLKAISGAGNSDFLGGFNNRTVQSGGAIIDTNGNSVTIGQALAAGSLNGGLTKAATAGTLTLSANNTYTGNTAVNGGTLKLMGAFTNNIASSPTINVAAGATLDVTGLTSGKLLLGGSQALKGSGSVLGTLGGSGVVTPGASPGILAATATDPSGGLDYAFELTALNNPLWSNTTASLNDVLRLTDASAPFSAALSASNTLTVDFNLPTLSIGDVFRGGIFTDRNSDFTALQALGNWQYTFSNAPLPGGATILRSVVQVASADFASGTVTNGWVTQFQIVAVPEPGSFTMLLFGSLFLWLVRKRS